MTSDEDTSQVTLSVNTLLIAVFVFGVSVGLASGIVVGSNTSLIGDTKSVKSPSEDTNNPSDPTEVFVKLGGESGADKEKLRSCIKSSNGKEYKKDKREVGNSLGRIGTPTFLIGNSQVGYETVSGAQPLSSKPATNMVDDIEEQLKEVKNGDKTLSTNETRLKAIELEGEPSKGEESATINVIEFSDYGCPFCSEWAGYDAIGRFPADQFDWFSKLESDYISKGKVRFIYKDYPVSNLHPNAPKAHIAANCVLEQSEKSYWKFHDKLFKNQEQWKK